MTDGDGVGEQIYLCALRSFRLENAGTRGNLLPVGRMKTLATLYEADT